MRKAGRAGVVGLLAAAALALTAAPALAADVDFGVELRDTTISADSSGKTPHVTFVNHGAAEPEEIVAVFDGTGLDPAKVTLGTTFGCKAEARVTTCTIKDDWLIPGPGGSLPFHVPLQKVAGATGAAGKLTVTVQVEGDTVAANNTRTAAVGIGADGADLAVYAQDVTWVDAFGRYTHDPVPPGEVAPFEVYIVNYGDQTASGLRVVITLPELVTFTGNQYEHCQANGNRRTLICELEQYTLVPRDQDPGINSGQAFSFEVRVSKEAKGPVAIQGGAVVATAVTQWPAAKRVAAAPDRPDYVRALTAEELAEVDADPIDNADDFAVIVRGPAPGDGDGDEGDDDGDDDDGDGDEDGGDNGGGGDNSGGDNGGGQGGGGGLPVTGPGALGIAGGGLAAVAAGAMLLVVTRRRRTVQE